MIRLEDKKRIITVSPSRLGDTIFRTPFFRLIKTINPHCQIDVIVLTALAASVLQDNPYIDNLFIQPTEDELRSMPEQYDLAVNMHESSKSQDYLQHFSCEQLSFRNKQYAGMHQVERLLAFFRENFDANIADFDAHYDISLREEHYVRIRECLAAHQIDLYNDLLIGFHMGCHGLTKKRSRFWNRFSHKKAWPLKSFIRLAYALEKYDSRARIILTGSKEELLLGEAFCQKYPKAINLMNQTSIHETVALMSYLKLFVTNDTGTLHIASATRVPIIALFGGDGDPVAHGPYPKKPERVVLQGKHITKVTPEEVFQVAKRLLKADGSDLGL